MSVGQGAGQPYDGPSGPASSLEELEALQSADRLGAVQVERLRQTCERRPDLIVLAHERETTRRLSVLAGESWSFSKHAREQVLPLAAQHHTLRKIVVILAHLLDLARTETPSRVYAFATQAYKAAQAAASHPNKEWSYGWPLLNIDDPDVAPRPLYTPTEHAALAAWHRDQVAIDRGVLAPPAGSPPWAPSLRGAPRGQGDRGSGGAGTGGGGGKDAEEKLRSEVNRLRKELQEAKKGKGKAKDKAGAAVPADASQP